MLIFSDLGRQLVGLAAAAVVEEQLGVAEEWCYVEINQLCWVRAGAVPPSRGQGLLKRWYQCNLSSVDRGHGYLHVA